MLEKPFRPRAGGRLRHDRAAGRIADADYLHRRAADELLERLDSVQRSFSDALILGPGTSDLAEAIGRRGLAVTVAGSARPSGHRRFVQCDEDLLPFRDGAFDLVLSVGALDTVNDLPGALTLIRRSLRPDGAVPGGAGRRRRLAAAAQRAMLAADEAQSGSSAAPRLHPQIDIQAAGDLLTRAGFALPVVDGEAVSVRFPNLISLIADLRAMGATNLPRRAVRRPVHAPRAGRRAGRLRRACRFGRQDRGAVRDPLSDRLGAGALAAAAGPPRQRPDLARGCVETPPPRARHRAGRSAADRPAASRDRTSRFGRSHCSPVASSGLGSPRHLRRI